MSNLGADVEALDRLARKFKEEADKIQSAMTAINGQLDAVWWKGRDADNFRQEWQSHHKPQLAKIKAALEHAGDKAKREAAQQRHTSGMA